MTSTFRKPTSELQGRSTLAYAFPPPGLAADMSKPTANWEKVGDKFYRKVQLYSAVFDQDLELENYNVVGAPYSGAVGRLYWHLCGNTHAYRTSHLPR